MRVFAAAVAVGVANAVVFVAFEWVVNDGTDWVWNDLADSDAERWRVVPLAIAGSIVLSIVMRLTGQRRIVPASTDPLAGGPAASVPVVLLIGAVSLLAGASLGPEASLVAAATGMGAWFASEKRLVLASLGALLVAFLGSLVAMAIPLVLLYRRAGRLPFALVVPIVVAGLTAYGTLRLFGSDGFGKVPASTDLRVRDFVLAFVLGGFGVLAAAALKAGQARLTGVGAAIDARLHWTVSAAVFGAVLGLLYLVGGQTVEFSGSAGSSLVAKEHLGTFALLGLVVVKLAATAWSLATGDRGGLVFPSIYVGVAFSLALGDLAGPGATIGAISGILAALTEPALGVVMLVGLLPLKLVVLGVLGTAGAIVAQRATASRSSA
ncbi:MAG TPA: chloride channel protein [Solirubrobacter sp.]